jgi:hypothetical protein
MSIAKAICGNGSGLFSVLEKSTDQPIFCKQAKCVTSPSPGKGRR